MAGWYYSPALFDIEQSFTNWIHEKSVHRCAGSLTCREDLIPYYKKFGFENCGVSELVIGHVTWYDMVIEK